MRKHFDLSKFVEQKEYEPVIEKKKSKKAYGFFVRFNDEDKESMIMASNEDTLSLIFCATEPHSILELITIDGRKVTLSYKEFDLEKLKKIEDTPKIPPFDSIPPLSE